MLGKNDEGKSDPGRNSNWGKIVDGEKKLQGKTGGEKKDGEIRPGMSDPLPTHLLKTTLQESSKKKNKKKQWLLRKRDSVRRKMLQKL